MTRSFLIGASALALAACQQRDENPTPATDSVNLDATTDNVAGTATGTEGSTAGTDAGGLAPATPAPTDAAGYLAKAGAGDMFEIESSKAILSKSPSPEVKTFAQAMVDAHTKSTEKVKAAAKSAKLTVAPAELDPDQQRMLDEIEAASGKEAETAYLRNQKTAHAAALALHRGYAAGGDTPALKTVAGEIAPIVQSHIDMLGKLTGA